MQVTQVEGERSLAVKVSEYGSNIITVNMMLYPNTL